MLSFLCFLFGCTPTKKYAEIQYGQGGGVTGEKTMYFLKESGELWVKKNSQTELALVRKLSSKELKTVYKELAKCNVDELALSEPDNIYFFLNLRDTQDADLKNLVWGKPNGEATEELNKLKTLLLSLATKE